MVALFHTCKSDANKQWSLGEFQKVMFTQIICTLSISKVYVDIILVGFYM